jgi:hypothetical protein
MSFKSDNQYRIIADIGAWNFRFSKTDPVNASEIIHKYKSRVGKVGKSGQIKLVSEYDSKYGFIDEVDTKFQNIFTKSVVTNFGLLDNLFDKMLKSYSIINEKRFIKSYSLSLFWKPFNPTRATCNFIEYSFEILGFGGLSILPLGSFLFSR